MFEEDVNLNEIWILGLLMKKYASIALRLWPAFNILKEIDRAFLLLKPELMGTLNLA